MTDKEHEFLLPQRIDRLELRVRFLHFIAELQRNERRRLYARFWELKTHHSKTYKHNKHYNKYTLLCFSLPIVAD